MSNPPSNGPLAAAGGSVVVRAVDYKLPVDAAALVELLDHYARDAAGGGQPLGDEVRRTLATKLAERPDAFSFLAFVDDRPVGLLNAFEGFSTFAAAPLLNVHDVVVHRDHRGRGVAHRLLEAAERLAVERGCCKLTLEVLTANSPAIKLYERFGFQSYQLDDSFGHAVFLQKRIDFIQQFTTPPVGRE